MKNLYRLSRHKSVLWAIAFLSVVFAALSGCGKNNDASSANGSAPKTPTAAIQSNPNMSLEAKAAAEQRVQQQNAAGAYMRQQAAKGK